MADTSSFTNAPVDLSAMINAFGNMDLPVSGDVPISVVQDGSLIIPIVTARGTFSLPTYAHYDPNQNPSRIMGWVDFAFYNYTYPPSTLAAVTPDIWAVRLDQRYVVQDDQVVLYVPPPPTQAESLAAALAALAAIRYTHEIAGYSYDFGDGPKVVPTDRDSQAKLNAAFVMASNGYWQDGTPWKLEDGSFVPMTKAKIMEVAVLASAHVAQCYGVEAQKAAAISAAADPASVDITTGWPG